MADFTLTEFKTIVAACFEGADSEGIQESTLETEFSELGFDSLVVYEIVTRIQDDYGVSVPDESLDELKTPAALIGYVSDQLAA